MEENYEIKPDVLTYEDVVKAAPFLSGHEKLVNAVLRFLWIDRVNEVHGRWHKTPGVEFSHHLVEDQFCIKLRVDNEEILNNFQEGPFITISNHPYGGFDGIILIHLVGKYRPDFKVMVNMFLNHLSAMRPSFIAVDQAQSEDPEKRKISMQGMREAMKRIKEGHPIGFFPAGAISELNGRFQLQDREWQPAIIRLIRQLKVPVIPIYFHGKNSFTFNLLKLINWRLGTLRLPREVFNKQDKEIHVSIGSPISVEKQLEFTDQNALGAYLREQTYQLKHYK